MPLYFLCVVCILGRVIRDWLRLTKEAFPRLKKGFDSFSGEETEDCCLSKTIDCHCRISSFFLRNNFSSDFLSDCSGLASFSNVAPLIAFRTTKLLPFLFDSGLLRSRVWGCHAVECCVTFQKKKNGCEGDYFDSSIGYRLGVLCRDQKRLLRFSRSLFQRHFLHLMDASALWFVTNTINIDS